MYSWSQIFAELFALSIVAVMFLAIGFITAKVWWGMLKMVLRTFWAHQSSPSVPPIITTAFLAEPERLSYRPRQRHAPRGNITIL